MVKYTADKFELRVATTENGLDTAPVLSSWESIKWKINQGRKKVPVGINSRLQEVYETLLDYSGSCSGWNDETAVAGSADIATAFGAFQQAALTPLYFEVKNKSTGSKIRLKKVKGDFAPDIKSPDGFSMWAFDFRFEDISKS
jgi:hypothetical protein